MIPKKETLSHIYYGLKSKHKKYKSKHKKYKNKHKKYPKWKIKWETTKEFRDWYKTQHELQRGKCYYCNNHQDDIKKAIDKGLLTSKRFDLKRGRRGNHLEVERKKPNGNYDQNNCVLICYFCNNAKSDVFSEEEFKPIAKEIGKVLGVKIAKLWKKLLKEISEQKWTFAKTYAKTAPHEYIVRKTNPKLFDKIKKLIDKEGYDAQWRDGTIYKYLKIGDYKYWYIEDILNREDIK